MLWVWLACASEQWMLQTSDNLSYYLTALQEDCLIDLAKNLSYINKLNFDFFSPYKERTESTKGNQAAPLFTLNQYKYSVRNNANTMSPLKPCNGKITSDSHRVRLCPCKASE